MTRIRVGILGASGYGGAALIRRLIEHPYVEISGLGSRQYLGETVPACWPQLTGQLDDRFQDTPEVIGGCEVLFCATPHGATAPLVREARDAGRRVIDLSADFRLPPETYAQWYGEHPHPELYEQARYGLVELHRRELAGSELVAVPGCNSSAAILALAPLAAAGLLGKSVIANILTGVSGAGRAAQLSFHYAELSDNAKPYKVAGTHRHTAEIEATLGRLNASGRSTSGRDTPSNLETHAPFSPWRVSFNPHLVPMSRGILATCYTVPSAPPTLESLTELYTGFYAADPMVTFTPDLPQTKAVYGSDRTLVSVRYDERSGHVICFAVTDNLGKGAAGQAVQNFNVMHSFKETLGLQLTGLWP